MQTFGTGELLLLKASRSFSLINVALINKVELLHVIINRFGFLAQGIIVFDLDFTVMIKDILELLILGIVTDRQ
jgi:hypothetical protein